GGKKGLVLEIAPPIEHGQRAAAGEEGRRSPVRSDEAEWPDAAAAGRRLEVEGRSRGGSASPRQTSPAGGLTLYRIGVLGSGDKGSGRRVTGLHVDLEAKVGCKLCGPGSATVRRGRPVARGVDVGGAAGGCIDARGGI